MDNSEQIKEILRYWAHHPTLSQHEAASDWINENAAAFRQQVERR